LEEGEGPLDVHDYISEMNAYYASCAPWHDEFMGYTCNEKMEALLGPIIKWCEPHITDRDVLEIACGTGNWTQVLSKRARSVLATDVNESALAIARRKTYAGANVTFRVADAYGLPGIAGSFTAAFAADWWSHIPKAAIPRFVKSLTGRLQPGSPVVLIDMLPNEILNSMFSHFDDDGNRISRRPLPNGEVFHIVKNFPTEGELRSAFEERADQIEYREHDSLLRWVLTLRVL
jgi:demethylmenaquinone methyltransferase/2-methoxy-6-polyprenyl-1,4-benzoquinol methylase